MNQVMLYRKSFDREADEAELPIAQRHFDVVHQRADVPLGRLVVGRFSVLPFYKELETDLSRSGSRLVNSYAQHRFVADMRQWCHALGDLTPRLYDRLQDVPENGPFVLKGETNSKKFLWNTHMYAANKREAGEVWSRLRDDMLLADQEIYVRDYVPLVKLGQGFNGLPISNEFRYFVCNGQIISKGFYWSSHLDEVGEIPVATAESDALVEQAIKKIGNACNFYAIDVAQTQAGHWIVIELNDGQMSGLSCNDPEEFYKNLYLAINAENSYDEYGYDDDCFCRSCYESDCFQHGACTEGEPNED